MGREGEDGKLVALEEALRPLADPVEIQAVAMRILGSYLGVTRVMYGEVEDDREHIRFDRSYVAPGAQEILGRFRMRDFGETLVEALVAGRTIAIDDIAAAESLAAAEREAYAKLGIAALAGVPLVKVGRLVANISVHDARPRRWTASDLSLIERTADRTWSAVERARAEAQLRRNEQQYRTIFDELQEGYALCELARTASGQVVDLRYLEMNRAFARLTGRPAEAMVGRLRSEVLPSVPADTLASYAHVVATGEPLRLERSALGRWWDVKAHACGGDRIAFLFDDITERKAAAAQNQFLLALSDRLATLGDADAMAEAAGQLLCRHLGASACRLAEHDGAVEPVRDDARLVVVLATGAEMRASLTVESATPRAWTDNEVALVSEAAHRVWTAMTRARAVAALREAENRANEANRLKDEFLATMSHELRTPLAAIQLWIGALRSGAVPPDEAPAALDAISQSAESQYRLIDDLLDLSRLASGKTTLTCEPTDVRRLAKRAVDALTPMALVKEIALVLEVRGDLGLGLLDPLRCEQILWNLLTNALKFTPPQGRVALSVAVQGGAVVFEVTDTGEGIAKDFVPHLFEKFRQANMGEARRHAGLGIGLALVKQLVELHGGAVEGESPGPGQGSTFRVRLPWVPLERAPGAPPPRPLDGLRVLLVDEDDAVRLAMNALLARDGAKVRAVRSAREALASLEDADVVVSDLGLPDAFELSERIAAARRASDRAPPPSCALGVSDVDRGRALEAGYDLYLAKPITPAMLLEAVVDLRDILRADPCRIREP